MLLLCHPPRLLLRMPDHRMAKLWRLLSHHRESCSKNAARCTAAWLPHERTCSTLPRSRVALAALEEHAQNKEWAKQPGAREVLAQPPFDVGREGQQALPSGAAAAATTTTIDVLASLDAYLQAREWYDNPEGPARRFLSHLLTYPLTLASGIREAGLGGGGIPATSPTDSAGERNNSSGGSSLSGGGSSSIKSNMLGRGALSVVCLGARAESTMPPTFWRETLFALPGVSRLNLHLIGPELDLPPGVTFSAGEDRNDEGGDSKKSFARHTAAVVEVGDRKAEVRWIRAMLGPAADSRAEGGKEELGAAMVGSSSRVEGGAGQVEETASAPAPPVPAPAASTATAEDDMERAERAVESADAFVLFNPGLGHPHLQEGWAGALKRLLATGKPIIVTCHSQRDLDRDTRVLREAGAARCCPGRVTMTSEGGDSVDSLLPRKNAFRSLMASIDPLSLPGAEELVSCNWGVLVVRGVVERGRDR